jgi:probable F420-dependent oxidoreductase
VSARPFRFGVGPGGVELHHARQWRDFARRVEGLGYSTLNVGDHLVGGYGPVAAIAAAAAATDRLRVGALTFGNDYRHPVVLAQETATLDVLSEGRLEVGIGAGWMLVDYERAGISMDPPATRVERLAEAITVLKGCWTDGSFTFTGEHYEVRDHDGRPAPVQRPHPPLLVGGAGPKVLALAGREADIVGLNVNLRQGRLGPEIGATATAAATDAKVARVRDAAAGRPEMPELEVYVHVTAVGGDVEAGRRRAEAALGLSGADLADSPHVLVGEVGAVVDALEARRERWGISSVGVSAEAVDELAPVVAALAGRGQDS